MGDPLRHELPNRPAISDRPEGDAEGRVVQLWRHRPRPGAGEDRRVPSEQASAPNRPPIEDIGKYERGRGDDDYRHRMLMNVLGFVTLLVLALAGIWLASTIAELRKNQDCVLSGRRDCARVEEPIRLRF